MSEYIYDGKYKYCGCESDKQCKCEEGEYRCANCKRNNCNMQTLLIYHNEYTKMDILICDECWDISLENPNDEAIIWASLKGKLKIVDWLLQDFRTNPNANGMPLYNAVVKDDKKMVELILRHPKTNPNNCKAHALGIALRHKKKNIIRTLLKDKRTIVVFYMMEKIIDFNDKELVELVYEHENRLILTRIKLIQLIEKANKFQYMNVYNILKNKL